MVLSERARPGDAAAQLELLLPDAEQAALLAESRLALGRPLQAVATPGLRDADAHFLMLANVPRAEALKHRADPNPTISAEALWAAAIELTTKRDYLGAAQLLRAVDPRQAADLKTMAGLQQAGDALGLAKGLRTHKQSLVLDIDQATYRGLSLQWSARPADSAAARNIADYLEGTSGSFQALRLLVEWLEQHPSVPNARRVLQDADGTYNELGAYGSWPDLFWAQRLKNHELSIRLRRVGKLIRQANP